MGLRSRSSTIISTASKMAEADYEPLSNLLNEPYCPPRTRGIRNDLTRLLQIVRHLKFRLSSIFAARFALFLGFKNSHS